jgi:hypothetical protein
MNRIVPLIILALIAFPGCHKKAAQKAPPVNLSEAEQKFVKTLREEHKLNVSVFEAGTTLWIYLPMEEDLVDYHGSHRSEDSKQKKQFIVSTFEGNFKDKAYRFMFDITDGVKTSKDPGYKSDATEAFVKNRTLLYGTINECFIDLEKGKAPEFIGVIVANTKKGIAYKTIFNLHDYTLYRSEVLPFEEYNLREISELYGDDTLVGDKTGKNLALKPIEWPWFLIEEIKNRVNFKFLRSDFPPDGDLVIEIAGIIANTFRYYDYQGFSMVVLKDIRDKKSFQFDPQQLASFHETAGMYTDRAKFIRMHGMQPMQTDKEPPVPATEK